jgi:hypothetical protein
MDIKKIYHSVFSLYHIPCHATCTQREGYRAAVPLPKSKFKKDRIISHILSNLLFSLNQSLKSTDDLYIAIFKNQVI